MNGLGGLLRKCLWQIGLLTPCSEVPWENTHSIQSRLLHHLWGHCAFLINETMHIYANTLIMNNITHFKINLKIIKCYTSFIVPLYNAEFCHAKLPHPLSSNVRVRNVSIALLFRYFYLKHCHLSRVRSIFVPYYLGICI